MRTVIVAVSGGVDSMCLLHMLVSVQKQGQGAIPFSAWQQLHMLLPARLIVAHFNHGIRPDAEEDEALVRSTAQQLGLEYVTDSAQLGLGASEAAARKARYRFLHEQQERFQADCIVTAHHLDDRLETAVINIVRGTSPRGLAALRSTSHLQRPLLTMSKQEIKEYSTQYAVPFREDSTNSSLEYLRNYIREELMPKLAETRTVLVEMIDRTETIYEEIDDLMAQWPLDERLHIARNQFVSLPHAVACEVMASWLRQLSVRELDQKLVERAVVFIKTGQLHKKLQLDKHWLLEQRQRAAVFVKYF